MPSSNRTSGHLVTYVAFLRGINVGGRRSIRMADLRRAFMSQGYSNVMTVLASGNIRFATTETVETGLRSAVEQFLKQEFGFEVPTLVRTLDHLESLVQSDPFKDVAISQQTKLYVTFLPEDTSATQPLQENSTESNYSITQATASEVCSALTLSKEFGTIELMAQLERQFGPNITTRTWQTVTRLLDA